MRHRPGPWKEQRQSSSGLYCVFAQDGKAIQWWICGEIMNDSGHGPANARLIAAAPELLEALRDLRDVIRVSPESPPEEQDELFRAANRATNLLRRLES